MISTPLSQGLLADRVFKTLQELTEEYSPRESATYQELQAARHLLDRLNHLGYVTSLQEFGVSQVVAEVGFTSPSGDYSEVRRAIPLAGAVHGVASGTLTYVGLAYEEDIPEEGLEGRVALIARGDILFGEKVERVTNAGAVGAIIYNNEPGLFSGWMIHDLPSVPTVTISRSHGHVLRDKVAQGDLEAMVSVEDGIAPSRNVIADSPNVGDSDHMVIVGAHYDTVFNSSGASDNGSGVAVVLTIAEHIADRSYPFDVRIILFGAEELGLLGSRHYVNNMTSEEVDSTIGMLNFDAFGSGSTLMTAGDTRLTNEAARIAATFGMTLGAFSEEPWGSLGGASDHAPFRQAGIPVLFLISDDISRINSPADEIQHINPELLGRATEIGILMLERLPLASTPAHSAAPPSSMLAPQRPIRH